MAFTNRRHSLTINSQLQSTETVKSSDEILFETLMNDPKKKAFLLNLLSQEKDNIEKYKQKEGIINKTPSKVQSRTYCESPTALLRRRALERNRDSDSNSAPSSPVTPSTPMDFGELLKGVVAYVEIRSKNTDRSAGAKLLMQSMGASVVDVLNRKVTHVVFKDGSFSTYQKAKLLKVHLVSVLWLEAIRKSNTRVSEKNYPALGTETYDINVTALYQDYENIVRDEQRRSLAVNSQRSFLRSPKRSRLTMLPNELRTLNQSVSSKESFYSLGRQSDVIPSSQEYETESIISHKGTTIEPERPNSATLEQENIEMASDDDSECEVINGHSMSQVKDSLILDLDVQLSQQAHTASRFSKSSSTPSESLLLRKSNHGVVDMELTGNYDEQSSLIVRNNVLLNSNRSSTSEKSHNSSKRLSNTSTQNTQIRKRKSTDTMPSLRISADSVPTQHNMPLLRISTEMEPELHNSRGTIPSLSSSKETNADDMVPLQTSSDNKVEFHHCNNGLETNLKLKPRKNSSSDIFSDKINIISIHAISNEADNYSLNVKQRNTSLRNCSSNRFSKNENSETKKRTSSSNALPLQLSEVEQPIVNVKNNKTKTSVDLVTDKPSHNGVELSVNNNNDSNNKLKSITNKKLRKLFNLNQAVDNTVETSNAVEAEPEVTINRKVLIVPLPRLSFDEIKSTKKSKHVIVYPIKKKKRKTAIKNLKNVIKSVKNVLKRKNSLSSQKEVTNDMSSSDQSKSSPNRRNSMRIQSFNEKKNVRDELNKENVQTTTSDEESGSPPKRRCTIQIQSSQSHISSQLQNRRSTLEFNSNPIAKSQKSQKPRRPKPSIVCTRFHKPEVQMFLQIVKKLGVFFVEDEVSKKTTHVVVGECKRTINLLRAICRGCWILTQEWLLRSLEVGKWLPEEDYELTEFSPAVQQCRRERQVFGKLYCMDIFSNCGAIYVSRNSTPRKSDLEELIRLCKGTIVKEVYHAKIIVGDWIRCDSITCVNEQWILDSITFNKRKSFKKYLFKSVIQN